MPGTRHTVGPPDRREIERRLSRAIRRAGVLGYAMLAWIVGGGVFLMVWQENSPPFSDGHDRAEVWAVAVLWAGLAFFGWQVWQLSRLTAWSRRLRLGRSLLAAWFPPFGYLYAERLLRRDLLSQLDIVRSGGAGDDATI